MGDRVLWVLRQLVAIAVLPFTVAVLIPVCLARIPLLEEPSLARRFGESYRDYCRHVPRILPRLRPWEPPTVDDGPT